MTNREDFHEKITLRPLEREDRRRVFEISAQVWDGTDYVPNVFEEWLKHENGTALGICEAGVLKGFAKLGFIDEDIAWLEGIRVDQSARGSGYGKRLTNALVEFAQAHGRKRCQLSSFIENYESLGIVRKKGFVEKWAYKYIELDPKKTDVLYCREWLSHFVIKPVKRENYTTKEIRTLLERLLVSQGTIDKGGYWSYDWTFKVPQITQIQELIDLGALYEIHRSDSSDISYFAMSGAGAKGPYVTLHFVEKNEDTKTALAYMDQYLVAQHMNFGSYMAPKQVYLSEFERLGCVVLTDSETDAYLFEKGL